MGAEGSWGMVLPPSVSPLDPQRQEHWKHFDDSVNAVSFGFVATAILISIFLLMAIFERLLRQRSSGRTRMDHEELTVLGGKHDYPSPKITIDGRGVLVLMPGQEVPTFIAHPVPAPCHPEPISCPLDQNPCSTAAPLTSMTE